MSEQNLGFNGSSTWGGGLKIGERVKEIERMLRAYEFDVSEREEK